MPDLYLTQSAGDARYVQSPGDFGAAGSIEPVTPGDTASAGVADAYARIDHQHAHSLHKYQVCTSGTRPSSPTKGDMIYETDTGEELVYYGATTGWQKPWKRAWGILGYAEITSGDTFTSITDIPNLTITFTAVANRRVKLEAYAPRVQNATTASMAATVFIRESSTTIQQAYVSEVFSTPNGGGNFAHPTIVISPTAGSHTYKVSAARNAGSDTHILGAAATCPAYIMATDLGPNGTVPSA